ncbi:MAG: hypothetical protein AAFR74_07720 [Pseudomonadota bacterium]
MGWIGTIGFFFLALLQLPAAAAPWHVGDNALYTSVSISNGEVEELQNTRSSFYGEYALNPKWTVTAKLESVAFEDASDFNSDAWRSTVRRTYNFSDTIRFSLEGGLLQGEAIGGFGSCSRIGAEVRAGAAWTGKIRKADSYSYVELAQREHDGCSRTLTEFGIGREATEKIWLVTQAYVEDGGGLARSYKTQSGILWKGERNEVMLGYRNEQGGEFQEDAVFVSIARRFQI